MMIRSRARALSLTLTAQVALLPVAGAWAFQSTGGDTEGQLVLVDGQAVRRAPRFGSDAASSPVLADHVRADDDARWRVMLDLDTRVPDRLYGRGRPAPGTIASDAKAAAYTRAFLAEWLGALAPNAKLDDFVLVANQLDAGIRTVAYAQQLGGMPVLGGQVSFRIKRDVLIAVASQAWPQLAAPDTRFTIDKPTAEAKARAWAAARGGHIRAVRVDGAPALLPVVLASGELVTRRVVPVRVDQDTPTFRWTVFADAQSGEPFAYRQELRFVGPQLLMNVPERRPGGARNDVPAPLAQITIGRTNTNTDATGNFTISGDEVQVTARTVGPLVNVISQDNQNASIAFAATASSTFTWDESSSEVKDAQLTTFVSSYLVKQHVRALAPSLRYVDRQLEANVNISESCNAFSDGTTINFFRASRQCENTGRLVDVVFHEFGHAVHLNALIRGVGSFDSPLSEGLSDYLAASITGDPGMGRGFFYNNRPLRDLDPSGSEARWPEDIADDPHTTGLIYAGALWDLRKSLTTKLGEAAAIRKLDELWYGILQRATDLPSTYVEALVIDDDDGNLDNGTPNLCEINEAFGLHGLAQPSDAGPRVGSPRTLDDQVALPVSGTSLCPGLSIDSVVLSWKIRGVSGSEGQSTLASGPLPGGMNGSGYVGRLPSAQPGQVIQYKVEVRLSRGDGLSFPDNAADPFYERFVGEVVPLYCTDFERDPEAAGWMHRLVSGREREGADDWQWGEPQGTAGSGDPAAARSGRRVIGNDLGGGNFNGLYQSAVETLMTSPVVDTRGHTNVRVQYWRWLNSEDGFFDQGRISANGQPVWNNLATSAQGSTHHRDREWRFQDVDVSAQAASGSVQIGFGLASDRGLEFGGWTIDDFCVVAFDGAASPVCGDGKVDSSEQCDDANRDDGDACRNDCTTPPPAICGDGQPAPGEACDDGNRDDTDGCKSDCTVGATARCGDGTVQAGEQCDDSNQVAGDGCASTCTIEAAEPKTLDTADGGGCGCSTSRSPAQGLGELALGLGLVLAARRRRR